VKNGVGPMRAFRLPKLEEKRRELSCFYWRFLGAVALDRLAELKNPLWAKKQRFSGRAPTDAAVRATATLLRSLPMRQGALRPALVPTGDGGVELLWNFESSEGGVEDFRLSVLVDELGGAKGTASVAPAPFAVPVSDAPDKGWRTLAFPDETRRALSKVPEFGSLGFKRRRGAPLEYSTGGSDNGARRLAADFLGLEHPAYVACRATAEDVLRYPPPEDLSTRGVQVLAIPDDIETNVWALEDLASDMGRLASGGRRDVLSARGAARRFCALEHPIHTELRRLSKDALHHIPADPGEWRMGLGP